MDFDKLSGAIIGCAIEVHKTLGPGLLESTYEQCLLYELSLLNITVKSQVSIPVKYKEKYLDCGYRLDLLVEDTIIIELKSIETLLPIHEAQILTYMKLANKKIGLLINFNMRYLKDGIKRFVL